MTTAEYVKQKWLLENLFQLQAETNGILAGSSWIYGVTRENKKIDWDICIIAETVELLNSIPWKHWADINAKPDYANIKVEVVDILHFVISKILANDDGKKILDKLTGLTSLCGIEHGDKPNNRDFALAEDRCIEDIQNHCLTIIKQISNKNPIVDTFRRLFQIVEAIDYNIEDYTLIDVYKLFLGKTMLNRFRTKNGYKEGTYTKIWDGVEDNVCLQEIINKIPNEEFFKKLTNSKLDEQIYQSLEEKYKYVRS